MANVLVVYWSGTGNTEKMAEGLRDGAAAAGAAVTLKSVEDVQPDDVAGFDAVALGCPSMGAEVLEETAMEPFVEALAPRVKDRKIALFGSYDWGDGQWMRDWAERMRGYGAVLVDEGLIVNLAPDADAEAKCRALGEKLATA